MQLQIRQTRWTREILIDTQAGPAAIVAIHEWNSIGQVVSSRSLVKRFDRWSRSARYDRDDVESAMIGGVNRLK